MSEENNYLVKKIYKSGDKPSEILEEDLTRKEAQAIVREDIEDNPDCEEYMIVFDSM